jgi:ABC-type transporter Mla MlaB component
MAASSSALRLEFARVTDVTGEGAALLLGALKKLRKQDRPLIVAGAFDLANLVRSMVEVGKRDINPALWLLLLEMLQFLDREKEFEETAMDYCVTYEVSPPSFEKPQHVEAATAERGANMERSDRYLLPTLMEGEVPQLLDEIDVYVSQYETAVLDFSRLLRIDYTAATALLNRLRPLAASGRKIECRDMNHLVAALFKLQGFGGFAKLYPHKY